MRYDPPPSSTGGRPHSRSNSPQPRPLASGFYFRKRTERLDWRMLASIHVERLQREVDVETLQRVIENITFCDVESEDLRYVDPNFIKLFQLSQLIIEYLLHSQDYLSDHREKLVEECDILARDLESLRAVHEREDSEVKNLRKENRALRKTIYAYQLMVKVPTSTNGGGPVTVSSYHRCHLCPKVFKSEVYLDHHLLRRHPGAQKEEQRYYPPPQRPHDQPKRADSPPPQKGIEMIEKVTETMERFSTRILEVERQLKNEMEIKLAKELSERQMRLEDNYKQERLRYEKDLQELKTSINQQMESERNAFVEERAELERLLSKALEAKKSSLGRLEDDDEDDKADRARQAQLEAEALKRKLEADQKAALQSMKNEFQSEIDDMRRSITKEATRDKRKLEEKLEEATQQLAGLQENLEREKRKNGERESELYQNLRNLESDLMNKERKLKEAIEFESQAAKNEFAAKRNVAQTRRATVVKPKEEDIEEPKRKEISEKPAKTKKSPRVQNNLKIVIPPPTQELQSTTKSSPPRRSRTPSHSEDEEDFERILNFINMHTESPLPTSPWIRTLHPHSPTDFHHLRDQLKSLFNSELSVRGVTSDVITHWGHLDVEAAFQSKLTKLHDEIRQKDQVPLRRKLREIIVDNVDEIIEAGFEDPEADVEWGIDMRKKYRNDRDTASSKRIRYSADVGSPKKKSSIAHTSATDKRTTESSVDYGRPKVKLAESDARKQQSGVEHDRKTIVDRRRSERTSVNAADGKGSMSGSEKMVQHTVIPSMPLTKVSLKKGKENELPSTLQTPTLQAAPTKEVKKAEVKTNNGKENREPPLPPKIMASNNRTIETIMEESDERNEKKSDDSFDVSDLSQLSEAEAAASDSWSESERDPKPKNQDLKKMNQAFNNLVVVSESKPTVNEPPRKSVPQSSDTFSDFDSDSESFGGTKLGTKPIAAGKKPFPVKNNAFASTANGSNVHNARKLTDKDSFSMDDSDLEVQMI